jgi:undecaprenyl-diphosphatase
MVQAETQQWKRGAPWAESTRRPTGLEVPVLEPDRGALTRRLAAGLGSLRPELAFVVVMLAGFALIAGISMLLGLLVTHVIEPTGIGAANERVNVWLAHHRTPTRTHASLIGSIIGGGVVLPIIAAVGALLSACLRKWRLAAYFPFALGVESGTYRATTLVVHSHRPRVPRLENLPVNASYPSGHTAAAIAVYGGIALLLTSRFRDAGLRFAAWLVAVALVAFVATSRMYRGMHHPLDVAGGVVVGILALCVIVLACRVAGTVAAHRSTTKGRS